MTISELKNDFARTLSEVETQASSVIKSVEAYCEPLKEEVAAEYKTRKMEELRSKAFNQFVYHERRLAEYETELKDKVAKAQKPLSSSTDKQDRILAQGFDERAARLVSFLQNPSNVANEIKNNMNEPEYVSSLISWTLLKWPPSDRSPLNKDFEKAIEEYQNKTGISSLMQEAEELQPLRRQLQLRKVMAEVNSFSIAEYDTTEADKLGLSIEDYIEVQVSRKKRKQTTP